MQLEKEKKEKRERERCRALAQRIAEEANPASAALLGEQMPLLAKALHRAGVEAEEWTESSEAELLVVARPRVGNAARDAARPGAAGER